MCISLGPHASVREAAGVMTRANCGSVLIMEPPDILLGILTERDLMTRVLARGARSRAHHRARGHDAQPDLRAAGNAGVRRRRADARAGLPPPAAWWRATKILGVFSVRDALPREIGAALSQAEFNEQVNDVLG